MNRLFYFGVIVASIIVLTAIFAPLIASYDTAVTTNSSFAYLSPSSQFWFGTDALGRDIFRASFSVHEFLSKSD